MKINFKQNFIINYAAKVAAQNTTFPQTEQSEKILQRNSTSLSDGARQAGNDIAAKANQKISQNLLGGSSAKIDIYV